MRKLGISLLFLLVMLAGCQSKNTIPEGTATLPDMEVLSWNGEKSESISSIHTIKPQIALTFNGLAERETMEELLKALKAHRLTATFFVEGMRVAQEPDLAKAILDDGHALENGTLTFGDMDAFTYEETYEEIQLTNAIFEKHLGMAPQFVRSRSGDVTEEMQKVVSTLDMKGVVGSSINPQDRNMQSADEITHYIERFLSRGSIIQLNTYINPEVIKAIPLIAELGEQRGYEFVKIETLMGSTYTEKALTEIDGYDSVKENLDFEEVAPHLYYRKNTTEKEIALTFDDGASEERTIEILDILREYDIKSTFFLIGKTVEMSPHLAKMIVEEGHEVASHSYNHGNVTEMSAEELQEDVVKAHQALTYALQEPPKLYFRPAQGLIDEASAKAIAATGIETIAMYDIASFDWREDFTARDIYNRIMERVAPGKVIVMHILDDTETVEALPIVIEELLARGYTFDKMSTWIESENGNDLGG